MNLKKLVNNILRKLGFQFTKVSSIDRNRKLLIEHQNVLAMLKSQDQQLTDYLRQVTLLTSQQKHSIARKVVIKDSRRDSSPDLRIRAMKNNGFNPSTFIDCYDCDEKWEKIVSRVFDGIQVTLIESDKSCLDRLHSNITEFSDDTKILNVHLCDTEEQTPQSEVNEHKLACHLENRMQVPKKKLDSVLHEKEIVPEFLRFGSRAIESGALEGATKSLSNAEVCILSYSVGSSGMSSSFCSNLLSAFDYVFYDVWSLDYRDYDNRLNTCDFVFVKSTSSLLDNPD